MRSPLFALIRKDLKGYFDQPTGYMLVIFFVALLSWGFFRSAFITEEASLRALFTVEFLVDRPSMPWLLALFVPAATMRLLAEEQRDGTLEILLTQPIRGWIVLLAKFTTGLIFVAIAILATVGIPIALQTAGNLDEGAIVAQYVGSLFLAASFVSIGLFTSSLTRNQIVAFILGVTSIALLMLVGMDRVADTFPAWLSNLVGTLSPVTHFSSIARGVIDLRDVLYFIALITTFLSAAYLMIRGKSLSHQSPRYRNLQLGVAGLIVLSLLVGWFGNSIGGRLDLTEDKLFTLSPATSEILSGLDDLLTLEVFESKKPPQNERLVARDVNDFLEDFRSSSNGKVKLVHRSLGGDEADAQKAQLAGVIPNQVTQIGQTELQSNIVYLGLVMTYVDRREVIPYIGSIDGFEYRLASLANRMTQREQDRKTVAFLAGHGEKSKDVDLRILASELEQQFRVTEIAARGEAPLDLSGVDVLIVPGPTQRVPDSVQDELHAYLEGGGKAMILIDPVLIDLQQAFAVPNPNSFADFLERYAVFVENNLVFDVQSNQSLPFTSGLPYPYWARVPTVDEKVTGEIDSAVMPWASSLGIGESGVGRVEVIPLLRTRPTAAVDYAYGDVTLNSPQLDLTDKQQFESDIAVAITGRPPSSGGDGAEQGGFRLVVAGDSEWLTDGVVGQVQSLDNIFLGVNLVDWLVQEDALASIRSKVVSIRRLEASSTRKDTMQYVNIFGVPVAFVLMGAALYLRRRNISLKEFGREG